MESSSRTSTFYFVRHAQPRTDDGDDPGLTEFGRQQAIASAVTHLAALKIDAAVWTEKTRTRQTVRVMIGALEQEIMSLGDHPLVGINWLDRMKTGVLSFSDMERRLQEQHGPGLTVRHWLDAWGPAWAFRERVMHFMSAVHAECQVAGQDVRFIVGTHNPLAIFAHPDIESTDQLGHADILRYVVRQDPLYNLGVIEIIEATILRCPLPTPPAS